MKIKNDINCRNKCKKYYRHHICQLYRCTSFYFFHKYNTPTYPNIRNGTNGNDTFLDQHSLFKRISATNPEQVSAIPSSNNTSHNPRLIPRIKIIQLSPYPNSSFVHLLNRRNAAPIKIPPIQTAVSCPQFKIRKITAKIVPTDRNHIGNFLVFISITVQISKNTMTHISSTLLFLKLPIPEPHILFFSARCIQENCDIGFLVR